jgi:hypothetical protein
MILEPLCLAVPGSYRLQENERLPEPAFSSFEGESRSVKAGKPKSWAILKPHKF